MTAISEVSICNQALIALGATTIANLTEDSKNARLCNAIYAQTRDTVLTDHVWNFAQKRAVLATVAEDPVWEEDDMTVVYQKPTDCLRINYVNIPTAIFKIEGDKILSNETGLKIKYTMRVTDPMIFFPKFVEALAARLSAELAYPISGHMSVAETLFEIYYKKKLPQAMATDSQQGTPEGAHQDEWLLARLSGSSPLSGRTGWSTWFPCF